MNASRLREQEECTELMDEEAIVSIRHFYIIMTVRYLEIPTRNNLEFSLSGILYLYTLASYLINENNLKHKLCPDASSDLLRLPCTKQMLHHRVMKL
jgi:hypothetical protein